MHTLTDATCSAKQLVQHATAAACCPAKGRAAYLCRSRVKPPMTPAVSCALAFLYQ